MSEDPTYLSEDPNNVQTVHKNIPVNGQELLQQQHELIKLEDKIEYKALTQLIGRDFIYAFSAVKENPTNKSSSERKYVLDLLDSLKTEDVVFSPGEMDTLRNELNVKTEGVNAFMKAVDNVDKIAICALDYTSMNRAKHLLNIKCGRVKTTSGLTVKRKEAGDAGEQFKRYSAKSSSLVTKNGIQVSVYKADITQLTLDAIVNVANEHLVHGGGVALAIARAAGHDLEIEGDEYTKAHGSLKVTDVVPTSSGNLPCKKVLHAVGPRWKDYPDKNLCQQHLAQTVFNCFLLAHKHHVTSLAMSSISSAIFGVPKKICATMYLAALQRFDYEYGPITALRNIHFVDISDEMVAIIQDTFTELWNTTVKPAKGQRSRTDTNGSEWDWDERAPCSPLEMKETGSRLHSFPRRVRREETHNYVEQFHEKYFLQQSDTRQFDGASPREKGTTQSGLNYPDRHTSTKMLPVGLSNNSSANDKPLRETDHTYGPIRSRSGQTRELDDGNRSTSSYVSRNVDNKTDRLHSANAQSSNYVHGIRELCNSSNVQSSNYMHDGDRRYNSATNDTHDRNGRYSSATNDTHDRNRRYSSATNDTHDRNRRYNSATNDTHDRNRRYNSATNDTHDRNGRYSSATNDTYDRNRRYNSATNDTHDRNGRYNSATNDIHDRNGRYNSATNDTHDRNGRYNSATNDTHDRNGRYSSATNGTHDRNGRYNSISVQVSNKYHQKIGKNSSIHTVV